MGIGKTKRATEFNRGPLLGLCRLSPIRAVNQAAGHGPDKLGAHPSL